MTERASLLIAPSRRSALGGYAQNRGTEPGGTAAPTRAEPVRRDHELSQSARWTPWSEVIPTAGSGDRPVPWPPYLGRSEQRSGEMPSCCSFYRPVSHSSRPACVSAPAVKRTTHSARASLVAAICSQFLSSVSAKTDIRRSRRSRGSRQRTGSGSPGPGGRLVRGQPPRLVEVRHVGVASWAQPSATRLSVTSTLVPPPTLRQWSWAEALPGESSLGRHLGLGGLSAPSAAPGPCRRGGRRPGRSWGCRRGPGSRPAATGWPPRR